MNFDRKAHQRWSDTFVAALDTSVTEKAARQAPRDYLGGSVLGEECARKLAYIYHGVPADAGCERKGWLHRLAEMGHDIEARIGRSFAEAGFDLRQTRPDGKQFGFATAAQKLPDGTVRYRIRGHCDGVFVSGPKVWGGIDLTYPMMWENKGKSGEKWRKIYKSGVKAAEPVHFVQVQIYMAYLGLERTLFTAVDRDMGNLYAEIIPFDVAVAQEFSDRAARIVSSARPEDMPRVTTDPSDFRCKFCDHQETCWAQPAGAPTLTIPAWMTKS